MPITHRVARYIVDIKDEETKAGNKDPPEQLVVVLDTLVHLPRIHGLLVEIEDFDDEDVEPDFVDELKLVFDAALSSGLESDINIWSVFNRLSQATRRNYFSDYYSPDQILSDIAEQLTKCLPQFSDIFCTKTQESVVRWLGGDISSRVGLPVTVAHFSEEVQTLEATLSNGIRKCLPLEVRAKAQVIPAPVLFISVTSSLLPNVETSSSRAPSEIRFPDFLDLETCVDGSSPFCQGIVPKYDLVSVISSSGSDLNRLSIHFKTDLEADAIWRGGSVGSDIDVISKSRAVSGNFYGSTEPRTHPRLLVYIRRDFPEFLEELHIDDDTDDPSENGSSVGKYRGNSKRGYDETVASVECTACASNSCSICASESGRSQSSNKSDDGSDLHDYEAPRPSLPPIAGLTASALEEQADLALANRRLKDAVDIYSRAINACGSSGSSSENQKSLQEKRDRVTRLIRLDTSVLLVEKGERALNRNAFGEARVHYVKAAHNQSDISHLKLIIAEIDQNIKLQTASQKILDAHAAMRAGQYQSADDLFRHAIALNPEKAAMLESVQATLAPLIKTENAQTKQKIGMQAFEEKRFQDALNLVSEAIGLLPESSTLLPAYYCDRAAIYCELKDFPSAIVNCEQALAIQGDFASAYFRMGTACFGCEKLDDALSNYEKAVKLDQSLGDQVKVKIRQVNSAREVQQRKERESERARQREDEQRAIQEKRMREEQLKKEKAEKLALEKSEKLERQRQKDEEKRLKAEKEKAEQDAKLKEKEAEKEKLREERLKKEAERLQEREAQKLEKERDRERQKLEKEQRRLDQQRALEEEKRRKEEFAQEMARVEQARKEVERQKEAEKEKARVEMENLIAEREKTRAIGAAAAEASVAESSSAVRSNCSKCSSVIDGSARYYALGHCNHRTVCSVCSLRMRSSNFGETDFSCVECKVNLDCVVCTISEQPFSKFQVPGNPGPDLQYDKKSRIFFPKEYFRTIVDKIWKFSCQCCQFESLEMDAFSKHLQSSHRQSVCQLCFKSNRQFPSEIDTYAVEAFEKHLTGVPETENELTGGGHPKCSHCDQLFYNESQLLVHLNDSHVSCNLCNPEIVIKTQGNSASRAAHLSGLFCPDAKDLRNHHIAVHHLCQNPTCRDKLVVFKTQNELDDHTSAIHTVSYRPIAAYYPGLQGSPPPTGAPSFIPQGKPSGFLAAPAVASGIPTSSLPAHKWMGQSPSVVPLVTPGLPSWNPLPGSSRSLDSGLFDSSDPLSGDGVGLNQFADSNFPPTSTFNVKAAEFKPSFAVQSSILSKGLEGSSGSTGNLADIGLASTSSYQLDIVQALSREATPGLGLPVDPMKSSLNSFGSLSGLPTSRVTSFGALGDLDSTGFGSDKALGNLKLGAASDPFKVSNALDDSLDFDAVMRLPLNFDDPVDSTVDSSFGPFRSTRKFEDEPALGSIGGMHNLPKLNDSSSGFYSGRNGYSDMPSGYGGGLGSGISDFPHLSSIGSNSYLPPSAPQDRFGQSGFQGHYNDPTPSLGGGYPVGFGSEVYSSAPKPSFDSMSYGVGMDTGLGSGILGGHGMQGSYRPSSGYSSAPSQQFFAERSLDVDLLPDSSFPNIAWLRKYGMGMYRYTQDASEIAMHIRNDLVFPLLGADSTLLTELSRKSNCVVKLERQLLSGARENFLVFQSGGDRSMLAIQMVAERLKNILSSQSPGRSANGNQQSSSVGLPSSSRLNIAK